MSRFHVAFDGQWQEKFGSLDDAVEWAQQVSETGRTVLVVEHRGLGWHFRAAFPEEQALAVEQEWKTSRRKDLHNVLVFDPPAG